jgi:hypothetical protein
MYNGLTAVAYNLTDVNPGEGGFGCIPGSHKSKAGTAIIFTEALTHGTLVRLLAVAIALLLRNLWILCQWMTLPRSSPGRPCGDSVFRFRTLLRWISRIDISKKEPGTLLLSKLKLSFWRGLMVETRLALQTAIQLLSPSPTKF